MTQPWSPKPLAGLADAGAQIAQLRRVLALVEELAGRRPSGEAALDEGARISAAYEAAVPIDQRRFDRRAAQAIAAASKGAECLLALEIADLPRIAPAEALADELRRALRELAEIVGA